MIVVAVSHGDAAGVVGEEVIALGHHDVAVIAGVIEAEEGIHLLFIEDVSGFGIVGGQAIGVGEDDARGKLGYLGLSFFGFHAVVGVALVIMIVVMFVFVFVAFRGGGFVGVLGVGVFFRRRAGSDGES